MLDPDKETRRGAGRLVATEFRQLRADGALLQDRQDLLFVKSGLRLKGSPGR